MLLNYEYTLWDETTIYFKEVFQPIEKLKRVNELSLFGFQVDIQNDVTLQKVSEKLKSLSSLRTFTAYFPCADWISLRGMRHFSNALSQMKQLSKLSLHFENCPSLDDQCLHALFKTLKKQKNLQSLELDFRTCRMITGKGLKDLTSTLKRMQFLKELCLGVANQTHKNTPDLLAPGLTHLISLNKLKIDFTDLYVSQDTDFSSLWTSSAHLNSLRVLSLDFSSTAHRSPPLKNLSTNLKSLIHLHTLSLSFRFCSIDSGLETDLLVQCLQSIPSLNNLTLDFSHFENMDGHILKQLSLCLGALTNLSEVSLLFNGCQGLGDADVEILVCELGRLPNLHSVKLNFVGCEPIKSTHYEALKVNKNIKNLTFDYQKCEFSK